MLILSHAVYALPFYIYNLINSYFPPRIKSIAINSFVSSSSLFFPLKSNCVCGNGPHWHRVPNELRAATSELTVNQRREENPQFAAIFTFHLHPTTSTYIYLHPSKTNHNQALTTRQWRVSATRVPNLGTFGKSGHFGVQKKALPVPVRKIRDHFYKANFPQKWGLWPLISFLATFTCVFGRFSFFGTFGSNFRR